MDGAAKLDFFISRTGAGKGAAEAIAGALVGGWGRNRSWAQFQSTTAKPSISALPKKSFSAIYMEPVRGRDLRQDFVNLRCGAIGTFKC